MSAGERDKLRAKLNQWRPVIEAALAWVEDTGMCHFCGLSDPVQCDHDEGCPLRGVEL